MRATAQRVALTLESHHAAAGVSLGSRGVRRLALGVASLPVLLSLNLARECPMRWVGLPGASRLTCAATRWSVTGNDAKDEGVLALSTALPRCPWLRHLNLSRTLPYTCTACFPSPSHSPPTAATENDFGDTATVALAKSCAQCKQLMLVDLSRECCFPVAPQSC